MHVAVDCRVVSPRFPGIGRATLETVRALVAAGPPGRLSLLTGPGEPPPALAALAGHSGAELVPVAAALRAPADQWRLPALLRRLRPDVYHATYYAIPALVPAPLVVTIYDLIPRLFPQYWPNPLTRRVINTWTAYAARRAARIIACSEATAHDVARQIPATAARVRVAPLGVVPPGSAGWGERAGWKPAIPGETAPYLLYVGSNKPHKNLPRLIAAFARAAPCVAGSLVIAGAWDDRYPEALETARRGGIADRVVFEHRPTDQRLDALYAGAAGFVFPSRYEGFGLPVLEAMAAGLPVATTNRGSLGEVAGDAALLFDPDDEASIAAAIERLLGDADLRAHLSAAGRARAVLFPWSRTAAATWAVYEEVAALRRPVGRSGALPRR